MFKYVSGFYLPKFMRCTEHFKCSLSAFFLLYTYLQFQEEIAKGRKEVLQKTANIVKKLNEKDLIKYSAKSNKSNLRIIQKNASKYSLDSVFFEATKRCNLNCIHYYNPQIKIQELRKEEVFSFISEAKKLGALKMRITRGEPFMRKNLFEILEETHLSMIDFSIFTNKQHSG